MLSRLRCTKLIKQALGERWCKLRGFCMRRLTLLVGLSKWLLRQTIRQRKCIKATHQTRWRRRCSFDESSVTVSPCLVRTIPVESALVVAWEVWLRVINATRVIADAVRTWRSHNLIGCRTLTAHIGRVLSMRLLCVSVIFLAFLFERMNVWMNEYCYK